MPISTAELKRKWLCGPQQLWKYRPLISPPCVSSPLWPFSTHFPWKLNLGEEAPQVICDRSRSQTYSCVKSAELDLFPALHGSTRPCFWLVRCAYGRSSAGPGNAWACPLWPALSPPWVYREQGDMPWIPRRPTVEREPLKFPQPRMPDDWTFSTYPQVMRWTLHFSQARPFLRTVQLRLQVDGKKGCFPKPPYI